MKLFAPLSLAWFVVTGLVVLLQLAPPVGVFLMILGAPFWSVLTVNLGFIGIAAEALVFRWVSRWWLVLPVLWFGGYGVWFAVDHASIRRAGTSSIPAEQPLAFDPARTDLLVAGPDAGRTAAEMLHDYDLPVIYSVSPHPGSRIVIGGEPVTAHRIAPLETCDALGLGEAGAGRPDMRREQRFLRGSPNPYCQYAVEETPRRAVTRVSIDLDLAELRYQPPRDPLPPFPMPMMGCGLNSNMAKWECGFRFIRLPARDQRDQLMVGPPEAPADRLALRLGLPLRRGAPPPAA